MKFGYSVTSIFAKNSQKPKNGFSFHLCKCGGKRSSRNCSFFFGTLRPPSNLEKTLKIRMFSKAKFSLGISTLTCWKDSQTQRTPDLDVRSSGLKKILFKKERWCPGFLRKKAGGFWMVFSLESTRYGIYLMIFPWIASYQISARGIFAL